MLSQYRIQSLCVFQITWISKLKTFALFFLPCLLALRGRIKNKETKTININNNKNTKVGWKELEGGKNSTKIYCMKNNLIFNNNSKHLLLLVLTKTFHVFGHKYLSIAFETRLFDWQHLRSWCQYEFHKCFYEEVKI